MTAKLYGIMVWVMNVISALWRNLKPQLELGILAIQIFFLDICETYQRAIERLTPKVEENFFTGWPKISKLFAHIFLVTGVIVGTMFVLSGIEFLVRVYIPWFLGLTVEELNALNKLTYVFLGCEFALIVVIRSIRKRGIIRTALSAVGIIIGIKGITLLLAWSLTLNYGVATPVLDSLIVNVAKIPDVIIATVMEKFIPWIAENIHIVFG